MKVHTIGVNTVMIRPNDETWNEVFDKRINDFIKDKREIKISYVADNALITAFIEYED
jgi:hypothetical protein